MEFDCPILTGVTTWAQLVLPERMGVLNSQVPQGHMGRRAVSRRALPGMLQLLQALLVLQDREVKQAIHTQVPRDKPGFKDGMGHQVLKEPPDQFRLRRVRQGW